MLLGDNDGVSRLPYDAPGGESCWHHAVELMMDRLPTRRRVLALEKALAAIQSRFDDLKASLEGIQGSVAASAPASEIERLNHAFDLIAAKAPISEIERLDQAFSLIAQLNELTADRAPVSEVARLDHAFDLIADRAPGSEIARLDHAIELIANHRASERVVEVPWVLGKYRDEARVLEVGYAFAEEHYLRGLTDLGIPFLVGLDAASSPRPAEVLEFHQVRADLLQSCFRTNAFDLILCVSTIEHIGRDNTRYGLDQEHGEPDPDHEAIRAMASWLAPGGRLLLTVPFGRFEDHGWLINYDMEHLDSLIAASDLDRLELTFFGWRPGGWREVEGETLKDAGYRSMGASHAAGVALVELRRGGAS